METLQKRALVIGATGQDASYLIELLLEKGYRVYGTKRNASTLNTERINHIFEKIELFYADITDLSSVLTVVQLVKPHEIYNLAAQSHVKVSFSKPVYTSQVNAIGTLNVLEAIRLLGYTSRFYQASTSEMFGKVTECPQTEKTPFYPRSPYGVSKLFGHWATINYRESYGLFACSGILFNHESARRGEIFVTRKITQAVSRIERGEQDFLLLGNLDAFRDWGNAKDYVRAMWLMLQQDIPRDFVIATGVQKSVRWFVEETFKYVRREIEWQGSGLDEIAVDKYSRRVLVRVDPKYYRPTEVDTLLGDATLARETLGWEPSVSVEETVREMMEGDYGPPPCTGFFDWILHLFN